MKNDIIFRAESISKAFGPTKALIEVDLKIGKGEIHGLIGENGSGKSTMASICAGVLKQDSGEMLLNDIAFIPRNSVEANDCGVCMVVQEQGTVGSISVAANIFLGREDQFIHAGILSVKKMNEETRRVLNLVGLNDISSVESIENLTFEDRKLVEIARALYSRPKLLIIDETTTALTIKGRDILYKHMQKIKEEGCSILFISHDIDEIMSLCDSLTILRDGQVTANLKKPDFNSNKIKQLMVGRDLSGNYYRSDYRVSIENNVVLNANSITYGVLNNVTFKLRKGEVLGIGGLSDCGMHEIGKILFGLIKPEVGEVTIKKNTKIKNPKDAIEKGLAYVSKNRDKESLMLLGSIKDNICLPSLQELKKNGIITKKKEKNLVMKWVGEISIKTNSIFDYCSTLSGGNKQKVVLAKWLARNSDILILDCPTRGIDIGVKALIYKILAELRAQGKSMILISEELPELIGMSDRILLLKKGRLMGEFKRDEGLSESILIEKII